MNAGDETVKIDGSEGEGGGQILRSALALALITGRRIELDNIRARRKKPGLMRQHLMCVRAATQVGRAQVSGDEIGSTRLTFEPRQVVPGEYSFSIGSAGSTSLVLQTILAPLMLAESTSTVRLEGGTHNKAAPSADFLQRCYLPLLARMGPRVELSVERHGFYPAGGGELLVTIQPQPRLRPLTLMAAGDLQSRRVTALVSKLPAHIGRRECDTIRRLSQWRKAKYKVVEVEDSPGPGNVVVVEMAFEQLTAVITGFGERGLAAEKVARNTYREARDYLEHFQPVDQHLADQLLLPMGLAAAQGHSSRFRTGPLSPHATTHIDILRRFLDVPVAVDECEDGFREVTVG